MILGFLKIDAINFAEPSGSSPALNPPENIRIWESLIAFSKALTDSTIWLSVMFLNTTVFTSAPASSNALPVSYSQFVPGNTGTNTFGRAILFFAVYTFFASNSLSSNFVFSTLDLVGNTPSNLSFH